MQPLLDGPRVSLTEQAVKGLLHSHSAVMIEYGATALDSNFAEVADISEYVSTGSQIVSDSTATIHRTCTLNIDSDVVDTGWSYLSGFVKPYQTFIDVATGATARFHLGVYTLTTPTRDLGPQPGVLQFAGYDLIYLLRQDVGDSYEVAAGTDPATAAAEVIGLAIPEVEVLVTPSGSTLTTPLTWPFDANEPVTYLAIIQTLLASIGYREVWVDWEGRFRIEPYIDMQTEQFEWTFDTADEVNIVADNTTQEMDLYEVPNWWRFVEADLTDPPVEGVSQFTWTDSSPHNPGSTANRGRLIRHIEMVPVTSYDDLVSYGQRAIVASLNPSETFSVHTQPFPLAWHLDLIQFLDADLERSLPLSASGERRVLATGWTLPLDGQSDMEWSWRTVTDEAATLGLTITTIDGGA